MIINEAFNFSPEQAAERARLSRATGFPYSMMENPVVLTEAQKRYNAMKLSWELDDAPESVVEWLKRPENYSLVSDDVLSFKDIARAMEEYAYALSPSHYETLKDSWKSGWAQVAEGISTKRLMSARMYDEMRGAPDAEVSASSGVMGLGGSFLKSLPKSVREPYAAAQRDRQLMNAEWWSDVAEGWTPPIGLRPESAFMRMIHDTVRAMPYTLTGMPLSAALTIGGSAIGGPIGGLAGNVAATFFSATSEAGLEQAMVFKELTAGGMSAREAYDKSFREVYLPNLGILFTSDFLQNYLTFGTGAKFFSPANLGNIATSGVFEGLEEGFQRIASDKSLGQFKPGDIAYTNELAYEMLIGFNMGLLFGVGGGSLRAAADNVKARYGERRAARDTLNAASLLDRAVELAAATNTINRTPDTLEDFAEQVTQGKIEDISISGAVLLQTFGDEASTVAESLGIDAADSENSELNSAADLTIRASKLLSHPEIYAQIKDDIRIGEGGMSRNEALEIQKNIDERIEHEVTEMAGAINDVERAGESALAVKSDIKNQLAALGHKEIDKNYAERFSVIYTAGIANNARLLGMDPKAYHDGWGLRLVYDKDGNVVGMGRTERIDSASEPYIYEQRVLQAISSADTSIRQVAAAFKKINWTLGTVNLDIGGGRFNEGTDYLSSRGVENLVFDPFNRDEKHNRTVIDRLRESKVDSATATNVLNVIREDAIRDVIIHQAARAIKPDGVVYFQIYEGDRKGVGKQTSKGWQNNAKTDSYSDAIRRYFGDVVIRGNIIEARNPNTVTPAIWSFNGNEVLFQRGYHGGPHRGIDRFSLDRIGTGEGAQAYGWGLYFAENREVGENYRVGLSGASYYDGGRLLSKEESQAAEQVLQEMKYGLTQAEAVAKVKNDMALVSMPENIKTRWLEAIDGFTGELRTANDQGQLYGVELPESDVLLDWDKPLSEQPDAVKEILEKAGVQGVDYTEETFPDSLKVSGGTIIKEAVNESYKFYLTPDNSTAKFGLSWGDVLNLVGRSETGANIYQALSQKLGSDRAASEYLDSLGIPGHQYLDQGSRDNGEGTHNFVIWNEPAVDVAETYYQGGLTEDASAGENSREVSAVEDDNLIGKAWPKKFQSVAQIATIDKMKSHRDYDAAKAGDLSAAGRMVLDLAADINLQKEILFLAKAYPDAIVASAYAEEQSGENAIPRALTEYIGELTGLEVSDGIVQTVKVGRTGSSSWYRMANRPKFDGQVQAGRKYIIVDDVVTQGGTLSELRRYIEANGGTVVRMVSIGAAENSAIIALSEKTRLELERRFGVKLLRDFLKEVGLYGGEHRALTESEAKTLLGAGTLNRARNRIAKAKIKGSEQVFQGVLQGTQTESGSEISTEGRPDRGGPAVSERGNPKGKIEFREANELREAETIISIYKNGDKSTFLHELGHMFLESRRRMFTEMTQTSPEQIRADWTKTLEWLGVADIDFTRELSADDQKLWETAQEKFAAAFEKYLYEGVAPVAGLQGVFRDFKKWVPSHLLWEQEYTEKRIQKERGRVYTEAQLLEIGEKENEKSLQNEQPRISYL
ncbi:hypothetical protein FACS1894187_20520 [Synergistales bacterium]|nr:hypothetical protein FACS1894187_20520 [Synergistales bacterium]